MKFFIGRIHSSLSKSDIEDYFSKFGQILYFKHFPKDKYGFLEFREPLDVNSLINSKDHCIKGYKIIVEISKDYLKSKLESYSDGRGSRYGYDARESDYRYNDRISHPSYDANRRMYNYNRNCSFCSRCPRHGSNPFPEVPNAHLKIVCDGIDNNDVKESDLRNFCQENNVYPTFLKVGSTYGIVELKTIKDKDEAFKVLDRKELVVINDQGNVIKKFLIKTKTYVTKADAYKEGESKRRRYREDSYRDAENNNRTTKDTNNEDDCHKENNYDSKEGNDDSSKDKFYNIEETKIENSNDS